MADSQLKRGDSVMLYSRKGLTLAGVFTWVLVAYVDMPRLGNPRELAIIGLGF